MNERAAGFTLIEVLVALFVMGVALAAGMRALGVVTQASNDLTPRLAAQWSADNDLAELRLRRIWPDVGERTFDCSQGPYVLQCREQVSDTPNPAFRRVEVRVTAAGDPSVLATAVSLLANGQAHVL
ncbi:MAG: type II secretion system minor pseudopilin GspI [Betaproteobacteria bacterium]|nr:type II secretion system minor pseudopilin GspI [Betaproteobacteria bacterium]MDE2131866.1 type II secretion system minor pseudopilin GspI [Betaproteobacteria bacterium]MDE2211673.1 type II secretion system minor pseudopilin GspI [Betaproteobacteria bacterium]